MNGGPDVSSRTFDDLVAEAESADVTGWGFAWLDGRATEQRPRWGYSRLLADRSARARSGLDIDTGGGEVVAEAPDLPQRMCVTESWPPNARRARELLGPRGVEVRQTEPDGPSPFPDRSFDLVTSRHRVKPDWSEISRFLAPGALYFAQHVGPAPAFELIEFFLGPLSRARQARDPATRLHKPRTWAWSSRTGVTWGPRSIDPRTKPRQECRADTRGGPK